MSSISYRPEIDGLRALAILPVIAFHLSPHSARGGYLGVDVFFVISGFLITRIVLRDLASGAFTFSGFWARRVRRILPAFVAMVAVVLALAWFFIFRGDFPPAGRHAMWALLSLANVHFWLDTGDYWGADSENSLFLHAWSLSVEEQFYVFFPILTWAVYHWRKQWLPYILGAGFIGSLALFVYGSTHHPTATFYLLPTRAWEIGAGSLIALLLPSGTNPLSGKRGAGWFSLLAIALLAAAFAIGRSGPSHGVLSNIASVAGAGMILALPLHPLCLGLLTLSPMRYIGRISYSLYLWHWPIIVMARHSYPELSLWILVPVIFLAGILSFHLIEQTTRHRKKTVPVVIALLAVVVAASLMISRSNGSYDISAFRPPSTHNVFFDISPQLPGDEPDERFGTIFDGFELPPREAAPDAYLNGGLIIPGRTKTPEVMMLGDSHGIMWSTPVLRVIEKHKLTTAFCSMHGVLPFVSFPISETQNVPYMTAAEKAAFDRSRVKLLKQWKPRVVVISPRWSWVANSKAETRDLMELLEQIGSQVILIMQPPSLTIGDRGVMQHLRFKGRQPHEGEQVFLSAPTDATYNKGAEIARNLAKQYPNCRTVEVIDLYAKDSTALALDGLDAVYLDDDHLTDYGTGLATERIEQAVLNALQAKP